MADHAVVIPSNLKVRQGKSFRTIHPHYLGGKKGQNIKNERLC